MNSHFVQATLLGVALIMPIGAANAGDYKPAPNRSVATASDYAEMGIPVPQAPTKQRPYHYMRFDAKTKAQYGAASPIEALPLNGEKLIVLNFLDESNRFSAIQTQVLEQTLKALAPRSENKELMLVDIAVRDAQGKDLYVADYMAFYNENRLGPNGELIDSTQIPYGVVYGEPLKEGGKRNLFDFALMNGVKTDADLNANAESIYGMLNITVKAYNRSTAASPLNN